MPFNGSGTFQRVRNWMQDAAAGIRIRADRHDSEDDNFAQGLSQCITKDGQTTITANLPMANYRHTNVGEAQAINQYARYDQMQLGKAVWADAGGTADAITATYNPNTSAPVDGQLYYVRASAANATTTPTFSPDGTTAQVITKYGAVPLVAGDISGAGHELILRYRLSDTKYELLNPAVTGVPILSGNNTFAGDNTFTGDATFTGDVRFPNDGTLTIASGAITVTGVYHTIDTEGSAATDDLETINGGNAGQILILRTADSARDIVLKSTGNIGLVADVTLRSIDSPIELIYDGGASKWIQRAATAEQGAKADSALQEQVRIVKASTSGNSITFSGSDIPIGTKKITINFMGVSKSGSNYLALQIGTSNVIETSGYFGSAVGGLIDNPLTGTNSNNGSFFPLFGAAATLATNVYEGSVCIVLSSPLTNKWCLSGVLCESDRACGFSIGGSKSISGVLDIIRITTSTGIDTFTNGSIGIICEK